MTSESESTFDINGICRGCLSDKRDTLQTIYKNSIREMFTLCTNLQITEYDGLPSNICSTCVYKCVSWQSFKQQCEQADLAFRNQLNFKHKRTIIVKDDTLDTTSINESGTSQKNLVIIPQNVVVIASSEAESPKTLSFRQNETNIIKVEDITINNIGNDKFTNDNFTAESYSYNICCVPDKNDGIVIVQNADVTNIVNDKNTAENIHASKSDTEDNLIEITDDYLEDNGNEHLDFTENDDDYVKEEIIESIEICNDSNNDIENSHNCEGYNKKSIMQKTKCKNKRQQMKIINKIITNTIIAKPKNQQISIPTCELCSKTFRNTDRLEAHTRMHMGKKPEVCKLCNKEFNNLRALRRHRSKHNDIKPYTCRECGKMYKYQTSLTLHKKVHLDVRRFVCDLCGKAFVRAHGLQSHLLSHSTETPFACELCGKKFKNQIMLRNHQMRHNGVKKFVCSECGKTFTTSAELITHNRTHTGIKPYSCSLCDKTYKTKSHLAVHFRSHTGSRPYACDLCPLKFAHNKVLKQHRLTHTGERPHICDVCLRPFRQKSTLKVHMSTHRNLQNIKTTFTKSQTAASVPPLMAKALSSETQLLVNTEKISKINDIHVENETDEKLLNMIL